MYDWRLTTQIEYIYEKTLEFSKFNITLNNDHSHCIFCWKKFLNGDFCYKAINSDHYICGECYNDFKSMFNWKINMSSKDKLYFALRDFVNGNYRTKDFCDWFSIIFFHELNADDLDEIEHKLFRELANIADRFSPYEEDLKIPNVYFNEKEVFEKAKETYNILINK